MPIDYRSGTVEEHATLIARTMPDGRVWNAKYDAGSVLGRLVLSIAPEVRRLFLRIASFVNVELDPLATRQLILEWEQSVGIPDQCFDRSSSLVERRRRVKQKLDNFGGVITAEDVVDLLADFGENIALVPGTEALGQTLGFGAGPYSTQQLKEIRHTLVVRVESDAEVFALPFPIQFATEATDLLRCLVERVTPANVALQFFFNQNLALPFTVPDDSADGAATNLTLPQSSVSIAGNLASTVTGAATMASDGADVAPVATAAIFEPTDIADLALWLDADDLATITDTAGSVSQWDDKSGNGFDVTQADAAEQPTISSINGNASLLFDGVDDLLRNSGVTIDVDPVSFAIVVTPTTVVGSGNDAFRLREGFNNLVSFNRGTDDVTLFHDAATGSDINLILSNVLAADQTMWVISRMQNAAGGTSDALDDQGNATSVTGPTALQVNADDLNVGANANNTSAWTGHIHELIVYERVLTAQERSDLSDYLNGKWSV